MNGNKFFCPSNGDIVLEAIHSRVFLKVFPERLPSAQNGVFSAFQSALLGNFSQASACQSSERRCRR
jgi:hypothetical protein